jgi:hypothetical protein
MQNGFITILVRREARFDPKILTRDRDVNVESKKAILQKGEQKGVNSL